MSHVHMTIDISCWHMPQERYDADLGPDADLTIDTIGRIRRDGLAFKQVLRQDDLDLAIREIAEYKRAGGATLVNMDLEGIGRDPEALVRISEATGLHVIASTGWYIAASHPAFVAEKSVEELAEIQIREIEEGIGGTGIRCGNIGEVGMSGMPDVPFQPEEEKCLRAAARAQKATGASLTVHPNAHLRIYGEPPVEHFDTYLGILEEEGADLGKVYMSHLGLFPSSTALALLRRGLGFVSYDHFGHEEFCTSIGPGRGFTPDKEEVALVMDVIGAGYADRVLIGCEIGWKTCYRAFGGFGYAHVYDNVLPWLEAAGASSRDLDTIMVDNPRRLHGIG